MNCITFVLCASIYLLITLHFGALILVLSMDVFKITLHSAAAKEIIKNYITFWDPGGINYVIIVGPTVIYSSTCGAKRTISQGQNLAVWILAAKLPNSDFEFCRGFWGGFFPPVFSKEKGRKNPPNNPPQKFNPEIWSEKIASDSCRSLFLTISEP